MYIWSYTSTCSRQILCKCMWVSLMLTFPSQEDNSEAVPDMVAPVAVGKVMEFLERYQKQLVSIDEHLAALKAALDKLKEEIKVGGCIVCVRACACVLHMCITCYTSFFLTSFRCMRQKLLSLILQLWIRCQRSNVFCT